MPHTPYPEEVDIVGVVSSGFRDIAADSFQSIPAMGDTSEELGYAGKFALPNEGLWVFNTPNLPAGARIVHASVTFTAVGARNGAAYSILLWTPNRDGRWNKPTYNGWTPYTSADIGMIVYDDSNNVKETVNANPNTSWGLRQPSTTSGTFTAFEKLGQGFVNNTGSDYTLGKIGVRLQRVGTPSGDIGLEIYKFDPDNPKLGPFPVGSAPLAVSSGIAASDITVQSTVNTDFTFHGANKITIQSTVADRHYLVAITGSYTPSTTNYLNARYSASTAEIYASGTMYSSGTGFGFDTQNYMEEKQLPFDNNAPYSSTSVAWTPGASEMNGAGSTGTTPDLQTIIQEAVNHPGYKTDKNILLQWGIDNAVSPQNYNIAMFEHATYAEPVLNISYIPRKTGVM